MITVSRGDSVESDAMNDRCLPVLVHKFRGDRWVTARVVPRNPEGYACEGHCARLAAGWYVQISV